MSLHDLRREYEERRRALIEQLHSNKSLDAATQHQIYGAIKEIENFLTTIDTHQQAQADRGISLDLSRDRPRPFVERSQKVFHKVRSGTGRVFTRHIPNATKAIVTAPKRYFDRKREDARLRREIEAELRARQTLQTTPADAQTAEFVTLEHPHQVLTAEEHTAQSRTLGEIAQAHPEDVPAAVKMVKKTRVKKAKRAAKEAVRNASPLKPAKRAKAIDVPSKSKSRPGQTSQGKVGGQHKGHQKHGHAQFKAKKKR